MEDRNPSPPPEFENEEVYRADSVGNTAISKQWVLTTLMEIINEVEKHADNQKEVVEVADDLQDSACKLWDICVDKDIAVYLLEFDIIEILYGVVLKSKAPRLTEISVGILANMACNETACMEMSKLKHLRSVVVALLASPDSPTLLETVRLIKIACSNQLCRSFWLSSVIDDLDDFLSCVQFILGSSTNGKLLSSLSEVLDLMFECSSGILNGCCNKDFVSSLLEATTQQCEVDPTSSLPTLCHSLHAAHLISETEGGASVVVGLRRNVAALLSFLFYQWMTSHPKVEYSDQTRMSSSEVSVSCCLSLAVVIMDSEEAREKSKDDEEEEVDSGSEGKNINVKNKEDSKEEEQTNPEIDDEDRELIIKFSQSVISAKGIVSALPVVSAVSASSNSNEFKTPLYFLKNSPRVGTPNTILLDKVTAAPDPLHTPTQTPEIHNSSPTDETSPRDTEGDFTPTAGERNGDSNKSTGSPPSAMLCDLAGKVLKTARKFDWIINGESPRKGVS